MDINAHLDGTGRSHATSQFLMTIIGRDRGTSHAHLETQERKARGNHTETPRENEKLTLEQPAQEIDERIHRDSKLTELKLNPRKNKRHPVFRLTRADENDDEKIIPKERGRSETGKERENKFSLTNGPDKMAATS